MPDDDPAVILDEKRAGTSPTDSDSYKNGLTDLQNLTAEIFNPAVKKHKHPLLTKQIDLKYPFAVFDYGYERRKKTPTIDGTLRRTRVGRVRLDAERGHADASARCRGARHIRGASGADYRMQTYLNWDDEYLYFAATAPFKFASSIELDCNADGYFHGKDNVRSASRSRATSRRPRRTRSCRRRA